MHVLPSSAKGRTKGSAKRGAKGSAKRNAKRSNLTQKDDFALVLSKRGFVLSISFFYSYFPFPHLFLFVIYQHAPSPHMRAPLVACFSFCVFSFSSFPSVEKSKSGVCLGCRPIFVHPKDSTLQSVSLTQRTRRQNIKKKHISTEGKKKKAPLPDLG